MSTGPRTQATFIQGNQSTVDHDSPHSALVYLFQEVSKLASPIHNSFMDTHSASTWLSDTSRQGPLIVKREEKDGKSLNMCNSPCQHNLSCLSHFNQMKKVEEESHSSSVPDLVESHPECNSPWKVLGLINLQCERLLQHSDLKESDKSFVSSATKYFENASTTPDDETDTGSKFLYQGQKVVASLVKDLQRACSKRADECNPQDCVEDSQVVCATASSQPQYKDTKEDNHIERQYALDQECKNRLSPEQDIVNVPFTERLSVNTIRTYSKKETTTNLSMPALTVDHNANVTFTSETQLSPLSLVLPPLQSLPPLFNNIENYYPLSNLDEKIFASKMGCTDICIEENSPQDTPLKSKTNLSLSATSEHEPTPVQKEEIAPQSTQHWRTKTPRKQLHPSRSADIQDPDFKGVTFRMDTELDDSKKQCRLLITSKYSKDFCKSVRRPRVSIRTAPKSQKTSSSDEESDPTANVSKGKMCASCCTRKTPMWRDAEDGTPLCNACGIRYKKYRVRCVTCWHIPRKESNSNSCCPKCGNSVNRPLAQRKHSA